MKWKKLGQIFEFDQWLKDRFISHAQSPQAVVFTNFVRVYFTSRKQDNEQTFISHPQYVDFDFEFQNVLGLSADEIIPRGRLGCFDEHGIFPFSPVRVGEQIWAYTSGWTRRVAVDVDSGIGLAISDNQGKSFQRLGDGPVLTASLYEPILVIDAFVRTFNDKFYMFYIFGKKWCSATADHAPERVYKIAFATSDDGINWQKAGRCIIDDVIDENECQALPTVIQIGVRFHMYFCYRNMVGFRHESGKGYRLGYAWSDDLVNWNRADAEGGIGLSESGWDSEMMCYPNLFSLHGKTYMLYNGNNFGREGFGLTILEKEQSNERAQLQ